MRRGRQKGRGGTVECGERTEECRREGNSLIRQTQITEPPPYTLPFFNLMGLSIKKRNQDFRSQDTPFSPSRHK